MNVLTSTEPNTEHNTKMMEPQHIYKDSLESFYTKQQYFIQIGKSSSNKINLEKRLNIIE